MKNLVKHKIIIIFFGLIFFSCFGDTVSKINKIRTFYKYDGMFFYGNKIDESPVEKGSHAEIFSIDGVSEYYRSVVQKYLQVINDFIDKNFNNLIDYYKEITVIQTGGKNFINLDKELTEKLRSALLPNLVNGVRCMLAVEDIQYIEVAIQIEKNQFAITIEPGEIDQVIWTDILFNAPTSPMHKKDVIDEYNAIKYHEWFYESNLKLRVVKQIRDKDGKYYGEIYADYYKLEEYDKLFDKDGNPKNPKEESK